MSSAHSTTTPRSRKSVPCRFYNQGCCRFGEKCKFSHDKLDVQPESTGKDARSDPPLCQHRGSDSVLAMASSPSSRGTSDARPRPKRGEMSCRAWKTGACNKGSKCRFSHDIDKPGLEASSSRPNKQKLAAASPPAPLPVEEEDPSPTARLSRAEHSLLEAVRKVAQEAEAATAAAARERAAAIVREEAAKTISQVVFGSIVTYSAGLDVPNLITGFETCTLRIRNLPADVKEDDIHDLLRNQGLDVNHFHTVIKKKWDRGPEAHVVTNIAAGRTLAFRLDGVVFQEEILIVEMSATNSLEGMNAASGQSSEILTISWRAPSTRYVAEYVDVAAANAKVKELDRFVYGDRRLKVEMNTPPRGRFVPNLRLNAIKINNLPTSVTDVDVIGFTGAMSVKRLPIGGAFGIMNSVEQITRLVRDDIERAVPGGLRKFDDPSGACSMEGVVSARAHFSSWDDAHTAYARLSDRRYGNQPVWLRLPDPMYFTLVIPAEQYNAQRTQWNDLLSSIKDRKACTLNVRDSGNVVRIQLSGSVKEATGALKVRVENLARGDKVEGWHRSLGNPFVLRVHSETGAYLRADWKRQSLKVYGAPKAVEHAREMIKCELDRLASLDYTTTLPWHSVSFFVREGIQQLKETLGENNVRFTTCSRKITVSGGEEARHALDRLIALSHKDNSGLPNASQGGQTCPICYDNVSSPHQLGCGHTYCVACFRHFISSALDSDQLPLTCLGDDALCRVPVTIPTIQQFLPPASFNRLLEAAFDTYIAKHPEEFKHCKTPDCTQIYRAVQAGVAPKTLHCPSCFSSVCNACHEDGHDGLSCAESKARRDPAEQERLNDAWIASQGGRVKKCPQCSVLIEKLEGCNHMTCRCGAHICWRCMGVFTAGTIYPHMNTAHGTIHDDLPFVPEPPVNIGIPVDIEQQRELLRQVEARRAAALQNANRVCPVVRQDAANILAHDAGEFWRREEERVRLQRREDAANTPAVDLWRREAERARLQRQRDVEEQERRFREHRLRREAEERRRAPQRERGGWCMIM